MTKVDLITGFLGSGKTTFILNYVDFLKRMGQKVTIIENEFGGVSIDSMMLKETEVDIAEVTGGCMCCTGKVAFQGQLVDAAKKGYDRIIVEPSGIYDVDEFFNTLLMLPVNEFCEIGSIITIADAHFEDSLTDEARYLMFSQLLSTGKLVLSKTQLYSSETLDHTIAKINQLMEEHHTDRRFGIDVCRKDWKDLTDEDYHSFLSAGYQLLEHERDFMQHGSVFTSRIVAGRCENAEDLKERLDRLMTDPKIGKVYRCKGLIQDTSKNWYEFNRSLDGSYIKPAKVKRGIFLVIGQDIDDEALDQVFISRKKNK